MMRILLLRPNNIYDDSPHTPLISCHYTYLHVRSIHYIYVYIYRYIHIPLSLSAVVLCVYIYIFRYRLFDTPQAPTLYP